MDVLREEKDRIKAWIHGLDYGRGVNYWDLVSNYEQDDKHLSRDTLNEILKDLDRDNEIYFPREGTISVVEKNKKPAVRIQVCRCCNYVTSRVQLLMDCPRCGGHVELYESGVTGWSPYAQEQIIKFHQAQEHPLSPGGE